MPIEVQHISTLDRLIATKQIAQMQNNEIIVQNLTIAIEELTALKESFKNNIMFFCRAPGKTDLNDTIQKITESHFKEGTHEHA